MGISSAGIGSGLDVNGIVTSLMNVEKKPLNAVAKQKTDYQSQISAYGSLKSALSAFQTSVGALAGAAQFNAQTVSSSNTSVFSATSNGNATIGDYAVTVSQLAKSQKLALGGFANTSDVVGTGTLTISFGTFTPEVISPVSPSTFSPNATKTDVLITIDSTNNTLAGVRDAINAANSSVSATIVNDGAGNRLVITSKDTGEVNSLKIAVADDDTNHLDAVGLSQLAYDPTATAGAGKNLTQVQAAKDAILEVDGIAVVKSSNTISDMIEGVTLNLLTTSAGNAVSLGVASNQEAIKTSVTAFVDAFNKLDTTLRNLTKLDEAGKASGALLGDATARNVINQIRAVMTNTVANGSSLNSLSQIGVSFQRTGQLALDATKLTSAITNNFGDIASLFAATAKATDPQISYVANTSKTQAGTYAVTVGQLGTSLVNAQGTINGVTATGSGTNLIGALGDASEGLSLKVAGGALGARGTINFSIGYAAQLDSVIKNLLSDTGILASRTDGISNSIKRLDKQTEALNVRLASVEARYRAQFTRLDTLLSSMSTTSSFLTQQIASINANRN
ncbi:MAG: flagellar filament capping protein FliD [Methylotenera sp.]|nr:flagellar filament capping protein FliD [Methylotenera sp.]MDP1753947.1 flagellar filament capping protein FliD [Methylotenera sp.]MDP1959285.1 flagellar filament capping protein FliD [Methylotenera sp.]MDP3943925.1 flagellar filament capping protein FliD [Methylotenera sp.]